MSPAWARGRPLATAIGVGLWRASWSVLVLALVAIGTAGALALGLHLVAATFLTAWALIGLNAAIIAYATGREAAGTVIPGFVAATAITLMTGGVALVGWWLLLMWAVASTTSPGSRTVVSRWWPSGRRADHPPTLRDVVRSEAWRSAEPDDARDLPRGPTQLSRCSTRQLVRLWSATSREIARAQHETTMELLVDLRRSCLAELELRDPVGFQRWLASGEVETPGRFIKELANGEGGPGPA